MILMQTGLMLTFGTSTTDVHIGRFGIQPGQAITQTRSSPWERQRARGKSQKREGWKTTWRI